MSTTGAATVDDADTDQVTYHGDWRQLRGRAIDYLGTVHLANTTTASATFVFNGTSVKVFGTLPPSSPPTSRYTLDSHEPVIFASPNVSSPAGRVGLYSSPPLDPGTHTLVIQPVTDGPHFYIDFLQYTPISASSSGPDNLSRTGTIVGATVGGVALCIIAALSIIRFRRRRRNIRANSGHVDLTAEELTSRLPFSVTPTPFVTPMNPISMSHRKVEVGIQDHPLGSGISTNTPPTTSSSRTRESTDRVGDLEPIRHRDAGAVPLHMHRPELPPAYEDRVEG